MVDWASMGFVIEKANTVHITTQHGYRKPTLYMMVGVCGSGKSTWIRNTFRDYLDMPTILSTDNYIEKMSSNDGITYNEGFRKYIKEADKFMRKSENETISRGENIIYDQMNLSKNIRIRKLTKYRNYNKIAIVFERDLEYLLDVNNKRIPLGRNLPEETLRNFFSAYERPDLSEGFDKIIFIKDDINP